MTVAPKGAPDETNGELGVVVGIWEPNPAPYDAGGARTDVMDGP